LEIHRHLIRTKLFAPACSHEPVAVSQTEYFLWRSFIPNPDLSEFLLDLYNTHLFLLKTNCIISILQNQPDLTRKAFLTTKNTKFTKEFEKNRNNYIVFFVFLRVLRNLRGKYLVF